MEEQVRLHFSLNLSEPLRKGLEKYKRPTPERTRLVLLLDWGVRGAADTPRLSVEALRAWVEFCADRLCEQCPADMRLLSVLALQSPRERHRGIAERVEQLSADPRLTRRDFTIELLPPLEDLNINDLTHFLRDENTSCPTKLIPDISEFIWQRTRGRFADTVALIEEAESIGTRGWIELYEKLKLLGHDHRLGHSNIQESQLAKVDSDAKEGAGPNDDHGQLLLPQAAQYLSGCDSK